MTNASEKRIIISNDIKTQTCLIQLFQAEIITYYSQLDLRWCGEWVGLS